MTEFSNDTLFDDGAAAMWRQDAGMLRAVLDVIPDIVSVQSPQLEILFYNKAGLDFLHASSEGAIGRNCYALLGRKEPCDDCLSLKAIRTGNAQEGEKYIPELDVWFEVRHPGEGMTVNPALEQLRDCTARTKRGAPWRVLEELEAKNAELAEAMQRPVCLRPPRSPAGRRCFQEHEPEIRTPMN